MLKKEKSLESNMDTVALAGIKTLKFRECFYFSEFFIYFAAIIRKSISEWI